MGHPNNIISLDPQLHTQQTCEETSLAFSSEVGQVMNFFGN
jgi:hypothetical protein